MAVLPKKYSKRGALSIEDYITYMSERIEFYAQTTDKKIIALEKEYTMLKKKNEESEAEIVKLEDELLVLKELLGG